MGLEWFLRNILLMKHFVDTLTFSPSALSPVSLAVCNHDTSSDAHLCTYSLSNQEMIFPRCKRFHINTVDQLVDFTTANQSKAKPNNLFFLSKYC